MVARWALGAVWAIGVALLLFLDGAYGGKTAPFTLLLALVISTQCCGEMLGLIRAREFRVRATTVYAGTWFVLISNWMSHLPVATSFPGRQELAFLWPIAALSAVTMAMLIQEALLFREPGQVLETLGVQLLVIVYLGVLMSFAISLRWAAQGAEATPLLPLASLLVTAKSTDVGAFVVGRLWGRNPLIGPVSPHKTVEGAIGGLVGSLLGSVVVLAAVPWLLGADPLPWWWIASFALVVGIAAQAGDLAESVLKRDARQKDSARLMPGLGGVLDLLDSILFAAPVAYLFWIL